MASTSNFKAAHSSLSSSPLVSPLEHEVFISFRGADTRHTFTDHLYYALVGKGIVTFRDDEELESGKPISRELLNAIEASRVAVVVLSENYASSSWCLEELAKVVECLKAGRMRVFPIFYHVDPSDVRHQRGTFAVAFEKHEKTPNSPDVQRLRDALTYIANLAGHHLKDGSEAKLIREVVEDIFRHLKDSQDIVGSAYEQSLVGINSRFQELKLFMDMESNDVQIIGISGMSGVGKTTLALVAFGRIRHKFDASSFLRDVKSCDISDLLDQLLWDMKLKTETPKWTELEAINLLSSRLHEKKVLIVFDDVDIMKFRKLAWKHNWFGLGSRIILTTEDESILQSCGAKDNIYKVKRLNSTEAQQLFCQHAFGEIHCEKDLEDICNEVVGYVEGHPLSLKVLGFLFSTKEKHLWKDMLEELRENPNNIIPKTLKMSYEELSDPLKELFLYIACFFCGNEKEHIVDLLVGCHKIRADHIDDLIKKSLITEIGGKVWMHQSLVEMGRQIVKQCHEIPDRMKNWDDVSKALEKNTEMNSIKGIMLNLSPPQEVTLRAKAFLKMTELRLLKICDVQLPHGLDYIPNELRLLEWHHYPMQSVPRTFQPKKLVVLIMCHSCIKKLPHGLCNLDKLKLINLSYSQNLMETPDVSGLPNLEKLICQGCENLNVVHTSIAMHKKLILLNFKDCKRLKGLPPKINIGSLETFILSGCSKLQTFPEIGSDMAHLVELYLDGTRCNLELPKSWHSLRLSSISSSIASIAHVFSISCFLDVPHPELQHNFLTNDLSSLSSLVTLNLSDCNLEDGALLDDIKCLSSLSSLDLSRNNFTSLPNSLSQLSQLKDLYLRSCTRLQSLPDLPLGIEIVEVPHCNSLKDYSNKITEWTSDGEGYSLIIGLIRDHRRTVSVSRLSDFYRLARQGFRRFLLRVKKKYYRCAVILCPSSGIQMWLDHAKPGSSVSIKLPPRLYNDHSWRGIALCAVIVNHKNLNEASSDQIICRLDNNGGVLNSPIVLSIPKECHRLRSFQLLLYIPDEEFRAQLDERNCISPSVTTNNPDLEAKQCVASLVYKEDTVDFRRIYLQLCRDLESKCHKKHHQSVVDLTVGWSRGRSCSNTRAETDSPSCSNIKVNIIDPKASCSRIIGPSTRNIVEDWTSLKAFPKEAIAKHISTNSSASIYLGVKFGNGQHGSTTPISVLESRFRAYLEDVYETGTVFSHCFPQRKIPPWFCCTPIVGPLQTEIRVPPYLLLRPDCRGFAWCVRFSFDKHPTAILNNLNAKVSHSFTCFMGTDSGLREIVHSISEDEVMISLCSRSFIWVFFIPPGKHLLRWTRSNTVRFCFMRRSAAIRMKASRFHFVDERSMKDFSHTMVQLITSYVGYSNELRMSCDKESAIYDKLPIFPNEIDVADSSKEDIHPERMPSAQDFDASSMHSRCFRPSKATQKWFSPQSSEHFVTVSIPPNLCGDNDWLGLTLYGCFSEEGDQLPISERMVSENKHRLSCRVQTRGNVRLGSYYEVSRMELLQGGQFVWILYLTGARVSEMMDGCSHIEASFTSDWPSVMVQSCGVRLLYQHNQLEFGQVLRHCNTLNVEHQEDHRQFLAYQRKIMEQNQDYGIHVGPTLMKDSECFFLGKDIRAEIKQCKKDLMEFDGCSVLNFCLPPRKIFSWFNHCSDGSSMTIDVPTHIFDDKDWMGLFLFTYFSVHECQVAMLETPKSTMSHQLICYLESNVAGLEPTRHVHVTNEQESRWICTEDEFLWLSYIPRGSLPGWLNQCTVLKVSFASDGPSLTVKRSGLRFFHLHDQEKLELIIYRCCWAILTPYCLHQFKAQVNDKTGPKGAGNSDQCLENEKSSRPFHRGESSEAKDQQNQSKLPEFDQYCVHYFCYPPSEILEWFSHQSDKRIMTILLPSNLHEDRTCMGLAICVSFSVLEPSLIIDLEFFCSFRCQFESNEKFSEEEFFGCRLTKTDIELSWEGGFNLVQYIPCGWFSNWGYQNSHIEVSIEVYSPCITMQRCGYRLLYHSDEIEWKKIIRDFKASLSQSRDVAHQVKKITKPTHEDKAKADTLGVCDEISPPKRVRGSPNPEPKFKGKCVIK